MAGVESKKNSRKRKAVVEEEVHVPDEQTFPKSFGGLEIASEDEGEDGEKSDDGEVDEFPEIDTSSDTEDEEDGDDDEDDEEEDEDEEDEEEEGDEEDESSTDVDEDDDELHIFPKAKTVVSDITGKPKRVYPPIEPDYDSDSSTEDVRSTLSFGLDTVLI